MSLILSVLASLASAASPGLEAKAVKREYRELTIATTSLPTCQQIGFEVDREALIEWSEAAQARAVAAGASEDRAREKLYDDVRFEFGRLQDRFSTLILLQGSISTPLDFSKRARGYWKRRCQELAREGQSADIFTKP